MFFCTPSEWLHCFYDQAVAEPVSFGSLGVLVWVCECVRVFCTCARA